MIKASPVLLPIGIFFVFTSCQRPVVEKVVEPKNPEFVSIFDGKTLDGWDGNPKFWRVEDEAITGQTTEENPTEGNTFIIWRQSEVVNFELTLEYRIFNGNSGIQYRSFEVPDEPWVVGGYQADFEAGDRYSGIMYGERYRGVLADRGQKTVIGTDGKPQIVGEVGDADTIGKAIKKEEWNEYHIIAQGNHFVHKINGVVTCEVTDEDDEARTTGILALQLHAGPPMKVQFRKIRLKKIVEADIEQPSEVSMEPKKKKIVLIAGTPSHGYGAHEHYAGCMLLARSLKQAKPDYKIEVVREGWPTDESILDGTDVVMMYADGGQRHPILSHLTEMDALAEQGVGLVCIHYAVEIPIGEGGNHLLKWVGGYFETNWSVNPHWTATFSQLPDHPISRGVEPFSLNDEWYYHMRFRPEMERVTPILSDLPGPESLERVDGPHSGNPEVRAAVLQRQEIQHVAWASERKNGQRGFGFTGGHFHWNWGNENFRRIVLNAIVWAAHGEVPSDGIQDQPISLEQLEENQDFAPPEDFDRESIRERIGDV